MSDDVHSRLGNLEAKSDIILEEIRDFKNRVGFVEKSFWWASGVAAAVVVYFGIYVTEIKQAVANITKGVH